MTRPCLCERWLFAFPKQSPGSVRKGWSGATGHCPEKRLGVRGWLCPFQGHKLLPLCVGVQVAPHPSWVRRTDLHHPGLMGHPEGGPGHIAPNTLCQPGGRGRWRHTEAIGSKSGSKDSPFLLCLLEYIQILTNINITFREINMFSSESWAAEFCHLPLPPNGTDFVPISIAVTLVKQRWVKFCVREGGQGCCSYACKVLCRAGPSRGQAGLSLWWPPKLGRTAGPRP